VRDEQDGRPGLGADAQQFEVHPLARERIEIGRAEFGQADTPTIITGVGKGASLQVIGIVLDKAGNNAFFRKDSGIAKPADRAGKKVALPPGDSHRVLWPAFARANGLDPGSITMVNVRPEGKQAAVATGQTEASFDQYTGFPLWERTLGKGNVGNLLWADYGLRLYGFSYFAKPAFLSANAEPAKGFLRATYRGWAAAQADHRAAVDALASEVGAGIDREALLAVVPYVMDLAITERSRASGIGWIDAAVMARTTEITTTAQTLPNVPTASAIGTNAFNPKIMPAA
jgi:NitT/TauT family transport system substrate-binding protein